jgi:broad specificity phosphatase PhoE
METAGEYIIDMKEHILLCEQQFGLFDGLSNEELQTIYPREYAFYDKCEKFEGRFWARMPLGESRFDVATRVHQAFGTFRRDRDQHEIENIIVVCHGVTLRAFVMMWCHYTPEWFDKEPNPNNCTVRLIKDGRDEGYI